jgi:hypothetical protein
MSPLMCWDCQHWTMRQQRCGWSCQNQSEAAAVMRPGVSCMFGPEVISRNERDGGSSKR